MFYRLVKRAVWDRGVPEYHFELMCYKRITSIGIYADGKCLKKAKGFLLNIMKTQETELPSALRIGFIYFLSNTIL